MKTFLLVLVVAVAGCASAPYPPFAKATPAQRALGQYVIDQAWATNADQIRLNEYYLQQDEWIRTHQNQ